MNITSTHVLVKKKTTHTSIQRQFLLKAQLPVKNQYDSIQQTHAVTHPCLNTAVHEQLLYMSHVLNYGAVQIAHVYAYSYHAQMYM